MDSISNTTRGAHLIRTVDGASYVLDMDMGVAFCLRDPLGKSESALRSGNFTELVTVEVCRAGEPMQLILKQRSAPSVSSFGTGIVESISQIQLAEDESERGIGEASA